MGRERMPRPSIPGARARRDAGEVVLATIVSGGAAVIAVIVPPFIRMSGHTGAEYVYLAMQLAGPMVFAVAGLAAAAVYLLGLPRVPHVVLAAISAGIVGALAYAAPMLMVGLLSATVTTQGAIAAVPAVFLGLSVAIAVRRLAGRGRASWEPRIPVAVTAVLAGLVAGAAFVVLYLSVNQASLSEPTGTSFLMGMVTWMLTAAIPGELTAAWIVLVVLLTDRWRAPRWVHAILVGIATALLLPLPLLAITGFELLSETATWGAVTGIAAGILVFCSERRAAPREVPVPVVSGTTEQPGPSSQ